MSNWDGITIKDGAGTNRTVGTHLDDNSFHHPTSAPVSAMIDEDTITISAAAAQVITIDPQATWMLIDLGTNDPAGTLEFFIQGRYTTGGDYYMLPFYYGTPAHMTPRGQARAGASIGRSTFRLSGTTIGGNSNDGSRLIWVPCAGVKQVNIETATPTLTVTNVKVRQFVGQMPWAIPLVQPESYESIYFDFEWTASAYLAGDCVGGPKEVAKAAFTHVMEYASGHRMVSLTVGWYNAGPMPDFDLYIANPSTLGYGFGDNDPADLAFVEAVRAVLEVRDTPAAGQYKIKQLVGGGTVTFPGIDIVFDYLKVNGSNNIIYFDAMMVMAEGHTFPAGDSLYCYATIQH